MEQSRHRWPDNFAGDVVEDDDRRGRRGIHHEAADADFDVRLGRGGDALGLGAGKMHGC